MSKWQKIDPAEIKVGDRVKCVDDSTDCVTTHSGIVTDLEGGDIVVGINGYIHPLTGTWYIAKPKKAKPPTRPDEPPVGSFFRVDRTGIIYWKCGVDISFRRPLPPYQQMIPPAPSPGAVKRWELITEPGDTITLLELTEKGDKKDGGV